MARFRNISNRDVIADFGVIGGKKLVKKDLFVSVLESVAPAYELLTRTWRRDDPIASAPDGAALATAQADVARAQAELAAAQAPAQTPKETA